MTEFEFDKQLNLFLNASDRVRKEFSGNYFRWPILKEDGSNHTFDEHYIYHIHWALKKLAALNPSIHIDVSSSLHFVTCSAIYRETLYIDIREPKLSIPGLTFKQGDIALGIKSNEQYESVSCLHVIEHLGLGRYGDSLDPNADLKAIANISELVRPGGRLLIAVPVGKPAIYFNAHRVYAGRFISEYFSNIFTLREFYFIPGNGSEYPRVQNEFESTLAYPYGCGCFEFTKKF